MEATAALPMPWASVGLSIRHHRLTHMWPVAASIALHGICLMALMNWDHAGDTALRAADTALVVEVVQPPPPEAAVMPQPQPPSPPQVPHHMVVKRPSLSRPASPPAPVAVSHAHSVPAVPEGAGATDAPAGSGAGGGGENTAGRNEGAAPISSDSAAIPAEGNPLPIYPVAARRAGREGRVVVLVRIMANGECAEAEIAESSGTPSLDEAAKATVRHWRFIPATHAGQRMETTLRVPVSFRLNGLP